MTKAYFSAILDSSNGLECESLTGGRNITLKVSTNLAGAVSEEDSSSWVWVNTTVLDMLSLYPAQSIYFKRGVIKRYSVTLTTDQIEHKQTQPCKNSTTD